jgi:hypothetical protein
VMGVADQQDSLNGWIKDLRISRREQTTGARRDRCRPGKPSRRSSITWAVGSTTDYVRLAGCCNDGCNPLDVHDRITGTVSRGFAPEPLNAVEVAA